MSQISNNSEVKLKTVNPTNWAGRVTSLIAMKARYIDAMKARYVDVIKALT